MHIDFALPIGGMKAGLKEWRKKGERAAMSYGFHMAVTSWDDQVASDMADMVEEGINSFKFFLAYKVEGRGRIILELSWSLTLGKSERERGCL